MSLFNVKIGAVTYVVAAESAEEIICHTHAEISESKDTLCVPVSIAELPVVAAPVAAPVVAPENN